MRRGDFVLVYGRITRLSGRSDWIELEFVERERTPSELMQLGIRLHLAILSLLNTIRELEKFGVKRSRKAVHDWVQKADLQPADGASPDHIALDETVIRINGQQFWLYAAVNPDTNEFPHVRLFTTTTTALTRRFLQEFSRNTMSQTPCFSSTTPNILRQHFVKQASDFRRCATEIGMLSNVFLER